MYLVPGGLPSAGGVPGLGGVSTPGRYLLLGGVPGLGGVSAPGGVPGPRGCTWSWGVSAPGGCTWSGTPPVDRHTPVNILPCPKLRLRAVMKTVGPKVSVRPFSRLP